MKKIQNKWVAVLSGILMGTVLGGCATTTTESTSEQRVDAEVEYLPRISVAQSSNGRVSISWPSKRGYRYKLFAYRNENEDPEYYGTAQIGTGEPIEVSFMWNPDKPLPSYYVLPEKISGISQ